MSIRKIFLLSLFSSVLFSSPYVTLATETSTPFLPKSLAPIIQHAVISVVNVSVQGEMPLVQTLEESIPEEGNEETPAPNPQTPPGGRTPPQSQQQPQDKPKRFQGSASGVIIDAEKGYVITNAHVVKNSKAITVTLYDGRTFKAKLVGSDSMTDIAVLQIKVDRLKAVSLSDSSKLKVGDFAIAIGNPFGLSAYGTSQTATFGIISAVERSLLTGTGFASFIQTDAAINPGNSGGGLFNIQGELIGINTGIITSSPLSGNVGIGLAIPSNMVQTVMDQIIQYGSLHRGLLGIFVQHLTPELAQVFKLKSHTGALVSHVNPGSPAEKAGLKPGDVITSINGQAILESEQVKNIVGLLRVGTQVTLKIIRDGNPSTLRITVSDIKETEDKQQAENPFLFGLALRNFELLDDTTQQGVIKGAQIIASAENTPAWRAGLRPGDVIIAINNQPVNLIQDIEKISAKLNSKEKSLLVHVRRGGGALFFVIQ